MSTPIKPPTSFWIVSALALVWNMMGVMAYISQVTMSAETLQSLRENERTLLESTPAWATGAFAIAVWVSMFACLMLLARKKIATLLFMIGFAGIVVQMVHAFFIANSIEVYGPGSLVMPVMVVVFGAALIWYSRKAEANGWIE
jgi:hypothetical protein